MTLASRDLGFPRVTCHQFAYSYVSHLCFSFVLAGLHYALCLPDDSLAGSRYALRLPINSLAGSRYALCLPIDLLSRFPLRPILFPTSYPYPIGRYSCLSPLRFLRLFVLVVPVLVYILGWRWDDPHLQSTLQPP